MSTISALVARTRTEIGDTPKLFEQNFTTTGGTNATQSASHPWLPAL